MSVSPVAIDSRTLCSNDEIDLVTSMLVTDIGDIFEMFITPSSILVSNAGISNLETDYVGD